MSQTGERPVFRTAEQIDQHGEKIAAAGQTAKKEIKHDQPAPVRRRAEKGAGGNARSWLGLFPALLARRAREN